MSDEITEKEYTDKDYLLERRLKDTNVKSIMCGIREKILTDNDEIRDKIDVILAALTYRSNALSIFHDGKLPEKGWPRFLQELEEAEIILDDFCPERKNKINIDVLAEEMRLERRELFRHKIYPEE